MGQLRQSILPHQGPLNQLRDINHPHWFTRTALVMHVIERRDTLPAISNFLLAKPFNDAAQYASFYSDRNSVCQNVECLLKELHQFHLELAYSDLAKRAFFITRMLINVFIEQLYHSY